MKRTTIALCCLFASAGAVSGQYDGNLRLGGIASSTFRMPERAVSPFTPGTTNKTFANRFTVIGSYQVDRSVSAFVTLEYWQNQPLRMYTLGVDLRPWPEKQFLVRAGKFLAPFGNFVGRRFDSINPLAGRPVLYTYRNNLSAASPPQTASDLLESRGRGNALAYPAAGGRGILAMAGEAYVTGIQIRNATGRFAWSVAITNGALSSTVQVNNTGAVNVMGRVVLTPAAGLRLGVSAARGAYLAGSARSAATAAGGKIEDYAQLTLGADAYIAFGMQEFWFELVRNTFESPLVGETLGLQAWSAEARRKLNARIYIAARYSALRFDEIADAGDVDGDGQLAEPWDFDVYALEAALGFRIHRNIILKASRQLNRTQNPAQADPADDITSFQIAAFF